MTSDPFAAAVSRRAELARRQHALMHFAKRLLHDLANFGTVTRSYTELLLMDSTLPSAVRSDIEEVHRAADGESRYLAHVSRFARVGAMRKTPVSVDDLIERLCGEHSQRARITCVAQSGCTVSTDANWCRDAITELVQNALDATVDEGPVTVRTARVDVDDDAVIGDAPIHRGSWGVIRVENHGAPPTPQDDGEIGDPFVTGKRGLRGAGLGLTFARAVAWQSDGELSIEHTSEGVTRVSMWIPVQ